jgi:sulfonate transport system permease protein
MTVAALALPPSVGSTRWRTVALPVALLLTWEFVSHAGLADPRFLPPLEAVAARGWTEITEGQLLLDIAMSLTRDIAGFTVAAVLGVPVGLALGLSAIVERVFGPTFSAYRQIALFAWIPLISMWFGTGEEAKIAFVALAAFNPIVFNSAEGARSIPGQYREVARVLTFGRWQLLRYVALPGAFPSIVTGLHLGLIYAWLATVGAEFFLNLGPGLGGRINEGRELFQMDLLLLCVLLLGLIGVLLNKLPGLAEARRRLGRSDRD